MACSSCGKNKRRTSVPSKKPVPMVQGESTQPNTQMPVRGISNLNQNIKSGKIRGFL